MDLDWNSTGESSPSTSSLQSSYEGSKPWDSETLPIVTSDTSQVSTPRVSVLSIEYTSSGRPVKPPEYFHPATDGSELDALCEACGLDPDVGLPRDKCHAVVRNVRAR
jgi:hypothetical protein